MQRQTYIQSISDFNRYFYIWPSHKPILLLGGLSDSIVKVIKPLHDMSEISTNYFAAYYLHYKEKPEITQLIYNPFLIWPPLELVLLPSISSDCVIQFIAIYHPYYKDKLFSNPT